MTSVDSNFNFLCGRPHGAGPSPIHMRPPEPDPLPPPCEHHKWMAPNQTVKYSLLTNHILQDLTGLEIKISMKASKTENRFSTTENWFSKIQTGFTVLHRNLNFKPS